MAILSKQQLYLTVFFLIFLATKANSQGEQMKAFENLIGGEWVTTPKAAGGLQSKSVSKFEWGLNRKIIKSKYYNHDPKTFEFGLRNEGIRAHNASDSTIVFYEFDRFGGITEGTVLTEGQNLHYEYDYHGELKLRDTWKFIDKDNYSLTVGVWKDGKWEKKYHEALVKRVPD
ncbi:MAG: hypothetical protein HEP71_26645 [Roseivirga sp.]|nr:hypothetical protein [Roseivirga sp.]